MHTAHTLNNKNKIIDTMAYTCVLHYRKNNGLQPRWSIGLLDQDPILNPDGVFAIAVNVFWFADGPRSLVVEPAQNTYFPGNEIKVTADSNPTSRTYKWVNMSTGDTIETTDTFTITEDMLGSQSLKVIVCVPISSSNTICKELPLNFTVIRKWIVMVLWVSNNYWII